MIILFEWYWDFSLLSFLLFQSFIFILLEVAAVTRISLGQSNSRPLRLFLLILRMWHWDCDKKTIIGLREPCHNPKMPKKAVSYLGTGHEPGHFFSFFLRTLKLFHPKIHGFYTVKLNWFALAIHEMTITLIRRPCLPKIILKNIEIKLLYIGSS